jgi:hypothetical protein
MQYRIISVTNCLSCKRALERLMKEVNDAIAQGWEPLGGAAIAYSNHSLFAKLVQTMIKRR